LAQLPIKKVVIACLDPNPEVAGKGIKILNEAGIGTEVGICEEEAKELNRAFFWRILNNRPYITLKWAETDEGFIARPTFESKWITSPISRAFVHKLRAEVDAVGVGGGTAFYDNPKLDVRNWFGIPPARIIIATQPQLPETHHLLDGSQRTILAWLGQGEPPIFQNIEVIDLSGSNNIQQQLGQLLIYLCSVNIQHFLVEGGAKVLNQFIEAGLWNEAYVGKSKVVNFGQGIAAPTIGMSPSSMFELGPDLWSYYKNQSAS
jgi:diaminohydroxyphosphoribosylaminopyrimidine deaminase/5-amino-6-(5-phosphoribosylamino)uracil reductase